MPTRAAGQGRFTAGLDDAVILPLVLTAWLARVLCQAVLVILVFAFDLGSALLAAVIASSLRVAIVAGDGAAWLIKRLAALSPMRRGQRDSRRDAVDRSWASLRKRLSPAAVAATTQSLLPRAMAWLFRRCAALSPGAALLVIAAALLWLPVSAAISLGMHAVLLAKAASLPAWVQLLHPVATIIAKSKVLVLPAYPAAWPQARKHPWVQAALRCRDRIAAIECSRKTAHRYRQIARALSQAGDGLRRVVSAARS